MCPFHMSYSCIILLTEAEELLPLFMPAMRNAETHGCILLLCGVPHTLS